MFLTILEFNTPKNTKLYNLVFLNAIFTKQKKCQKMPFFRIKLAEICKKNTFLNKFNNF